MTCGQAIDVETFSVRRFFLPLLLACCTAPPQQLSPKLEPGELVAVQALSAIRSDGKFLYYIEDANGGSPGSPVALKFMKVSVDGGPPMLVSALPWNRSGGGIIDGDLGTFEIDSTNAYVSINGEIIGVPLDRSPIFTVTTDYDVGPMALDSSTIYFLVAPSGFYTARSSVSRRRGEACRPPWLPS